MIWATLADDTARESRWERTFTHTNIFIKYMYIYEMFNTAYCKQRLLVKEKLVKTWIYLWIYLLVLSTR